MKTKYVSVEEKINRFVNEKSVRLSKRHFLYCELRRALVNTSQFHPIYDLIIDTMTPEQQESVLDPIYYGRLEGLQSTLRSIETCLNLLRDEITVSDAITIFFYNFERSSIIRRLIHKEIKEHGEQQTRLRYAQTLVVLDEAFGLLTPVKALSESSLLPVANIFLTLPEDYFTNSTLTQLPLAEIIQTKSPRAELNSDDKEHLRRMLVFSEYTRLLNLKEPIRVSSPSGEKGKCPNYTN